MTFVPPRSLPNTVQGGYFTGLVQNAIANGIHGTTVEHYQAQWVEESFSERGTPDYLAGEAGEQGTGIRYTANPQNPLKGAFCPTQKRPVQGPEGQYYQADMELYLAKFPGDVYRLDDKKPKLQDRFVIQGQRYYAIAPAMPCTLGDSAAAWKILLTIERSPVGNDTPWS